MDGKQYVSSAIECIKFQDDYDYNSKTFIFAEDLFNEWCAKECRSILQIDVRSNDLREASYNQIFVFYLLSSNEMKTRQEKREKQFCRTDSEEVREAEVSSSEQGGARQ